MVNDSDGNPINFEDGVPLYASFGLKMCRPSDKQTAEMAVGEAERRAGVHKKKVKAERRG